MTNTIILVQFVLIGSDQTTQHDLQSDFLHNLPEQLGRAQVYDARIVKGLVDSNDVPIKQ